MDSAHYLMELGLSVPEIMASHARLGTYPAFMLKLAFLAKPHGLDVNQKLFDSMLHCVRLIVQHGGWLCGPATQRLVLEHGC